MDINIKINKVKEILKNKKIALAFSAGADSTLLAYLAKEAGADVLAITYNNQIFPSGFLEFAKRRASEIGIRHEIIEGNFLDVDEFVENSPRRCLLCRNLMYDAIKQKAHEEGYEIIIDGNNITDLTHDRPGILMKYKYEIDVQGYASSHGYVDSNKILAENRANTIVGWMKDLKVFDFENGNNGDTIKSNGNGQIQNTNKVTESDFKPKAARVAVVTFKIRPPKTIIDEVQAIEDRVEVKKIHNESAMTDEYYNTSASDDFENQTYDNEYTYFKQLNENDDLVKRYISDKVKYFNPAFHSITPEGFNARLTFLQQCLRQGPTISASDDTNGGYGAGNLSFGRAPFCILRIGDFFNTKICINSINITYDNKGGIQWDMNPEGVGLQPMFANVDINFTFLGGSDISGPIARLQNAASFNYYANTSVYERRSDWRDGFAGDGTGDAANTWSPMMIENKKKNVISYKTFYTDHGNKNTNS